MFGGSSSTHGSQYYAAPPPPQYQHQVPQQNQQQCQSSSNLTCEQQYNSHYINIEISTHCTCNACSSASNPSRKNLTLNTQMLGLLHPDIQSLVEKFIQEIKCLSNQYHNAPQRVHAGGANHQQQFTPKQQHNLDQHDNLQQQRQVVPRQDTSTSSRRPTLPNRVINTADSPEVVIISPSPDTIDQELDNQAWRPQVDRKPFIGGRIEHQAFRSPDDEGSPSPQIINARSGQRAQSTTSLHHPKRAFHTSEIDAPSQEDSARREANLSVVTSNHIKRARRDGNCGCLVGCRFLNESITKMHVLERLERWRSLNIVDRLAWKWTTDDLPKDVSVRNIEKIEKARMQCSGGRNNLGGTKRIASVSGTRQLILMLYCLHGHPGRNDLMQRDGYCPHCFARITTHNENTPLTRIIRHFVKHMARKVNQND